MSNSYRSSFHLNLEKGGNKPISRSLWIKVHETAILYCFVLIFWESATASPCSKLLKNIQLLDRMTLHLPEEVWTKRASIKCRIVTYLHFKVINAYRASAYHQHLIRMFQLTMTEFYFSSTLFPS